MLPVLKTSGRNKPFEDQALKLYEWVKRRSSFKENIYASIKFGYFCLANAAKVPPMPEKKNWRRISSTASLHSSRNRCYDNNVNLPVPKTNTFPPSLDTWSLAVVINTATSAKAWSIVKCCKSVSDAVLLNKNETRNQKATL